jgi:hypothetical protein
MLKYRDFVPRMHLAPGLFRDGDFETFQDAVDAANAWIATEKIRLISLETVVLPNIWSHYEEGSQDVSLSISGDSPSRWHQFLRCWYQEEQLS